MVKDIELVVTSCGGGGISTLMRMLRNNEERKMEIVGVEMDEEAVSRFLADKFLPGAPGDSDSCAPRMLEVTRKKEPDIICPVANKELYAVAGNKAKFDYLVAKVLISDPEVMRPTLALAILT